jgi:hypothetical protein
MNNNINFKELRLDNYICINNNLHPCRVKEITITSVVVESIIENYNEPTINSMNPIPLTEEWLLKFGFENSAIGYEYAIELDKTLQLIDVNNEYYPQLIQAPEFSSMESQIIGLNLIKYLHQLQNLYFALTNEELTMK